MLRVQVLLDPAPPSGRLIAAFPSSTREWPSLTRLGHMGSMFSLCHGIGKDVGPAPRYTTLCAFPPLFFLLFARPRQRGEFDDDLRDATGNDMPLFSFLDSVNVAEMVMMNGDTGHGRNGSARLR